MTALLLVAAVILACGVQDRLVMMLADRTLIVGKDISGVGAFA